MKSEELASAFERSSTPFLSSYRDQAWPVDSVVAIASLKMHDHHLPSRFTATRERWLKQVDDRLDPVTGLIPHRVDAKTGKPLMGARGSSQALLLRFLLEIDPLMGRRHYVSFRSQFAAAGWLLPGVREYPHGIDGEGDVDSGPLIGGVSLSATVTSIAPARMVKDDKLSEPIFQIGEGMGIPMAWQGERRYLGGQLPIADAFLVYARTAQPWAEAPDMVEGPALVSWWWRLAWHAATLLPICGLLYFAFRKRRG
ncbi:MAG TPA: hypothetical protein VFE62_00640 [Gemmataceae bacterium]|nr:hypothetical protein [Gemmataceae bacterium]